MDEAEAIRVLSEIIDRYEKTNDTQDIIYGWGIVALGTSVDTPKKQENYCQQCDCKMVGENIKQSERK